MPMETDKNEVPTLPFVCYKLPKRNSIVPEGLNPDVFVWVLETPEECSTSMKTFVDKVRSALTLRYDGVLPQHIATALNEPEPVNVVPATKVLAAQQEKLSPSIPQSQRSCRISKATGSALRSNLGASSQANRCFSRQPKNPLLANQQPEFSFQPLPKEVRDYLVKVDGDIDLAVLLHRLRYERRQQQKQYIQLNAQNLVHDAYSGTNSDTHQSVLQCRTLGSSLASLELTGLESSQYANQLEQNSVSLPDQCSMPFSQRFHVNATVDTPSELCATCSGSTGDQKSSTADNSTLSNKKRRLSAVPSLSTTTSMPNSDPLREPSLSLESRRSLCHEMADIAQQLLSQAALLSASNFIDYQLALSSFSTAPNRVKSQDQSLHERITNCLVKLPPSALFGSDVPCNTYDDCQRLFTNACLSLKDTPK